MSSSVFDNSVSFTDTGRLSPKLLPCSQTTLPDGGEKKIKLPNFECSFKDAIWKNLFNLDIINIA